MKKISTILVALTLIFVSCKEEPNITYQYQLNDDLFYCDEVDMDLIKEAVYAFEDYIKKHYSFEPPKSIDQGYYFYWEISFNENIPAVERINDHVLKIRDELKKHESLWTTVGDETTLNYEHPLLKCIADNLNNSAKQKLFTVLIESKTFKNSVFLSSFTRSEANAKDDKALATYFALNTFYAKILNLDFSNLEALMELNRKKYLERQKEETNFIKDLDSTQLTPLKPDNKN